MDKDQRLSRLYAVSSAVNNAIIRIHDIDLLHREVCRIAVEAGGMRMAWVGLAEPSGDRIQAAAWWGVNEGYVQAIVISSDPDTAAGQGPGGEAFRSGQSVACNDISNYPGFYSRVEAAERGYRSCAVFPLKVEEAVIGIFVVYSGEMNFFTSDEMTLLTTLSENLSFAMESQRKDERKRHAEAALRSSQEHLRDIVASVDGIVWEADAETFRFTFVSPRAETLLGYPLARWLEPSFWADHVHPEDREMAVASCQRCTQEQRGHQFEYRMIAADGRAVWLRDLVTIVPGQGSAIRLRGIMVDVSEGKQAEQRMRHSNRVYAVLTDINERIVREPETEAMLAAVCRIAVEKGRFPMAWIGLNETGPSLLRIAAHAGATRDTFRLIEALAVQRDCAFTSHALQTGEHGICNDIDGDPRAESWRRVALERNYRAMVSLPLKAGEKVIGIINLYAAEAGFFDAEAIRLLDELAVDISFALEIARREAERRAAEERHVRQRNALIGLTGEHHFRSYAVATALWHIAETAARTLGVARVGIWRSNADRSAIECVDLFELESGRHSSGAVLSTVAYPEYFRALSQLDVIASDDAAADARTREFRETYLQPLGIKSMLDVPIQVGGVLDGVLCHEHIGSARQWTADEKTFAVAMANLVSLTLEGAERARAERAVAEKTEMLEMIFNNAPVMLCFIDAAGRVQMANRELERVTGWTLHEIQSHPNILAEWYPDAAYRSEVMAFIRAGSGQFAEFHTRIRSGKVIVTTFANVLLSGGTSLGIGLDVTERKASERQVAAFATLGKRLGDANTPTAAARIIMDTADDLLGWDACWLHMHDAARGISTSVLNIDLVDGRRQDVAPAYAQGAPSDAVRRAVAEGPLLILREETDAPGPDLRPFGDTSRRSASLMIVPVRHGGDLIAALSIQSYRYHAYRKEDLASLEALADYCGGALAQIGANEARRESEERFRELAENIEDVFWITDPSQTLIYYISPAYERVWGRSCVSLYDNPRSWTENIFADDRDRILRAVAARAQGGTYEEEYRIVRPDSELRWIRDRAFPVRNGEKIVRIVGVSRDVTQSRRAQQQLRQREEEFRALIENAADLITVVNVRGVIRFQSPSVERILGYPAETMIGRSAFELVHPDDVEQVKTALSRSMTDPETPIPVEYRVQHLNGTWHTVQSIGRNIPHRAADGFIVINSRDITDNRRLEEQFRQSQKMEAIGQLAGGVAHDFNNILTVIQGYASMLMGAGNPSQETAEAAQQIVHAAERAANLTRQLLAFSRRQVMQTRRLDLNESVIGFAKMLQRIVGEDVRLQLNLHPRPLMTRADAGMLDQVLMNLVVNARDAMPQGGQLVIETRNKSFTEAEARAVPDAKTGPYVCFRVADTGTGIAADILPRIFEPFFTTKDPGKGTGLGLATVFGIVKQHGGALTVESEAGQGTAIEVFLPAAETEAAAGSQEKVRSKPRGGTETILIVEDEPSVRILTRVVLERHGYRVLEAADGVEAQQVWDKHRGAIDLLLTDMVMPEGVTGRELAMQLQERNPKLRVIFTSGYSADIAGRELTLQEGQNFLQKPTSPDQILATIRRSLDG